MNKIKSSTSWLGINIILIFFFIGEVMAQKPQEVWVFSTTANQNKFYNHDYLSALKIKHFTVDGGQLFEEQLSEGLSANPDIAKQQIQQKLAQNQQLITSQLKQAWQGVVNAQALDITKIPAITFDQGKSIIYGEFDLLKAYRVWQTK